MPWVTYCPRRFPKDSNAHTRHRLAVELDASEDDEVQILANNLPVAKDTVVVQGNRIAVEVLELLPRAPDVK